MVSPPPGPRRQAPERNAAQRPLIYGAACMRAQRYRAAQGYYSSPVRDRPAHRAAPLERWNAGMQDRRTAGKQDRATLRGDVSPMAGAAVRGGHTVWCVGVVYGVWVSPPACAGESRGVRAAGPAEKAETGRAAARAGNSGVGRAGNPGVERAGNLGSLGGCAPSGLSGSVRAYIRFGGAVGVARLELGGWGGAVGVFGWVFGRVFGPSVAAVVSAVVIAVH